MADANFICTGIDIFETEITQSCRRLKIRVMDCWNCKNIQVLFSMEAARVHLTNCDSAYMTVGDSRPSGTL